MLVNNKQGVKVAISMIFALVIVIIMIAAYFGFLGSIFMGGPEYTATDTIYEALEDFCGNYQMGDSTEIAVFMPDSSGTSKYDYRFFSISISDDESEMRLNSRGWVEESAQDCDATGFLSLKCNDPLVAFVDWVRDHPNSKTLKKYKFKNCRGYTICGNTANGKKCGKFSFESNIGKEFLELTFTKSDPTNPTILIDLVRGTVCGDGRCCEGEDASNCPEDCNPKLACSYVAPICGDGVCSSGEDINTCPDDCTPN